MKSEKIERSYKMNGNVSVHIKSKRVNGSDVYSNTVTMVYTTADTKPIELASRAAIQNYIGNVDFTDDQQNLFGDDDKDD